MPIKPKISAKPSNIINETKINDKIKPLVISFKHLDLGNKKYSMNDISDNKLIIQYYNDFNEKIIEYSQHTNFKEYITSNRRYAKVNNIHPIDWKDNRIKESCFTHIDNSFMEQIKNECWQLGINNDGFRVHGFFIENTFFVVWLDPNHVLYKRK